MKLTAENIREELLKFRDNFKMTQIQVSEKTGISRHTLVNIERGRHSTNSLNLYRLEKLINAVEYKEHANGIL
jgi:DNA-binding XRE family transcriptional regulator